MRHGGHAQVAVLEAGVSVCKTGCGKDATYGGLCQDDWAEWMASGEECRHRGIAREDAPDLYDARSDVAFVDFCNRMRAERQARRPA